MKPTLKLCAAALIISLNLTASAAVHYVSQTSPAPTAPFSTWDTAATNIQDAIDAATAGDEIVVTNGVYATGGRAVYGTMTNRVVIDKALTVRSVNGPELTFIVGQGVGTGGTNLGDGAIRCAYVGTNAVISGFTLTNGFTRTTGDTAERSGGAAWCDKNGVLTNCVLAGNSAYIYGGGAYNGFLVDSTLTGNSAYSDGTGPNHTYSYGGGAYGSILSNCWLTGNSASVGGGANWAKLYTCILTGNSAGTGGGAARSTLINCTVAGNKCLGTGGGVDSSTLTNCIVYFNAAPGSNNYSASTFSFSCTTPLPPGIGNIDSDPLFASATRLSTESPCIGRGSPDYATGVDIDGEAWLNPPCMGADQVLAGTATGSLAVSITAAYTNVVTNVTVSFQAQITGIPTTSVWDFGDGIMVTNQPYTSHAWTSLGTYQVRLTAYNESAPGGVSATTLVRVAAQEVYFVNAANPTPLFPYATWATAATSIQDAMDAGTQVGRLVRVTNGVYTTGGRAVFGTMTNRVTVTDGVELRSESGPLATIIVGQPAPGTTTNGDGAIRCVYLGLNSILSGFTLTNGHTRTVGDIKNEQRGGGAWCEDSAVITNCILTGNSAQYGGGGAIYGTLNNCLITGNSSTMFGGGVYSNTLNNCVISGNTANNGGGASSATLLNNCILTGNSALTYGGAAYMTVMRNCTLTGNSAGTRAGGADYCNLYNSIVYYNTAQTNSNYSRSTFTYSCTTPLPPGEGNLAAEPLLASATHLSSQSPCIGSGSSSYISGVDIDGEPWLNPPCIGADQFVAGAATGQLSVTITSDYTNVVPGFRVSFAAQTSGHLSASAWDFGDGVIVSNQPYANHTWAAPGVYQVRFKAYNDSFPDGVSTVWLVRVAFPDLYYVNAANPNPLYPYTTWAGAATNIQDAIDAGTQPGRVVRVTNGVYASGGRAVFGTMTNRVVVPDWVEVRSENGPLVTFIVGQPAPGMTTNGDGAIRCVYLGANAVLVGFTLTNGHTRATGDSSQEQSGGGAWCGNNGVLNKCILAGNSAYVYGGGAWYGTLNNCLILGNSAVTGGGGAYRSGLNNCTVVGNSANYGGGTWYGALTNCIDYYNTGPNGPNHLDSTLAYSCAFPLPSGTGNISTPPVFINSNGWANLRLQANSPCIDAGNPDSVSQSTDLDGNPRIVSNTVDLGAYEFQAGNSYPFHYVNPDNLTPHPPYTNWQTAARSIQDAVDESQLGDTVFVTNGVYASGGRAVYGLMTNRLVIDRPITVQSVNGPNFTWIVGQGVGPSGTTNGDGAIRCVYLASNAVLSGFTLTNGHTRTTGDASQEQSGGGAWCDTNAILFNCVLTGNAASSCAGGAWSGTLNNCSITGNSATTNGGGAYRSKLNNCTLTDNSAQNGGGAHSSAMNNCTLIDNSAGSGGGAYYGTLNNCIIYYNTATSSPNYYGSTNAYSCSTPLAAGEGNIDADPIVASTTHLSAQSPCIGRGSSDYTSGVDIDGEAWLNPPCMGADQFVPGMAKGSLTVSISAGCTNVIVGDAISFVAENTGPISATVWDFGDGVIISNRIFASHVWSLPGMYEVRLTSYNDTYPSGVSAVVVVKIDAREVYYVNASNLTPSYPYTNWAGAATTIQDAIDAGTQSGRLVRVTNGIYATGGRAVYGTMTNRVVLQDRVELRSENGPLVTSIVGQLAPGMTTNGDGAIRCVYLASNAVLSGFTLTNGHTRAAGDLFGEQSAGGAWCEPGGVLTNCILTRNSASYDGGAAYHGTLNNCTIVGNSARYGGGSSFGTLSDCTLTGNSAGSGGGAFSGTLNNCTLAGNSAGIGGGVYIANVKNCIIYYNIAQSSRNYLASTFVSSCTTPLPGTGNFTNAPLFVNTNNWADLRLQPNSPCINAGNNDYVTASTDLDGKPRIAGGRVDIGAYEFQGVGLTGLPGWLWQYGLPTDGSADSTDSDRDGLNNYQEWRAGTDPTNAASVLRLTAQPSVSTVQLQWQGVSGINYYLQRSTNLSATPLFQPLATNISGTAGPMTYTDDNPPAQVPLFYRLGVLE